MKNKRKEIWILEREDSGLYVSFRGSFADDWGNLSEGGGIGVLDRDRHIWRIICPSLLPCYGDLMAQLKF